MTDSKKALTNVEILRVLRQYCLNEDMYYHFIWVFTYTEELNRLKENSRVDSPQRRLMLNEKLNYYLNKLNQRDKEYDQL